MAPQNCIKLWSVYGGKAGPLARATVEYLDTDHVGDEVLSILRDVQNHVGAVVPYRPVESDRIAIYSGHAEHLADKLLQAMPVRKLPPSLKGARLEVDLGM